MSKPGQIIESKIVLPFIGKAEGIEFKDTINKYLFWDTDHTQIDLQKDKKYIIERVLEKSPEWVQIKLMINYYSIDVVKDTVKNIYFLTDRIINFCHVYFDIPKEEMLSYRRKKEMPDTWM